VELIYSKANVKKVPAAAAAAAAAAAVGEGAKEEAGE